jgi:hypothetical protein
MSQPLISVRQLDANHDVLWGNGQGNFLVDLQAVAQIIQTTLLLLQGEWWANINEGLPLFQSILGSNSGKAPDAISLLIQQTILSVRYVTGISNIVTTFAPNRAFTFSCLVATQFGVIQVSFQPATQAVLPT